MEPFSVKSFFNYLNSVRSRTNRLIQVIPPDSLDFAYMSGKFTVGDQIRHIATIERYLFAEIIAGRESIYNGCGKELADGYTDVLNFFNELYRESLQIFNSLHDEDMNRKCMTPGKVEIFIWKWLLSMTEHEIHHRAQLYIYLNMLRIKTPPMFGLTSEELQEKTIKTCE